MAAIPVVLFLFFRSARHMNVPYVRQTQAEDEAGV